MTPHLLIADSGSTKTDWRLIHRPSGEAEAFTTAGFNPMTGSAADLFTLPDHVRTLPLDVVFYGAGCRGIGCERMRRHLQTLLPAAQRIEVESDLLAAIRAAAPHGEHIVVILGTGANSAWVRDGHIVQQTPALGYLLGDEGSGTSLGKHLLAAVLRGELPQALADAFFDETDFTPTDAVATVCAAANPRTLLAPLTHFLHRHIQHPAISAMVSSEFAGFIRHNISRYAPRDVVAVGSVAHAFRPQLEEALRDAGFRLTDVLQRPIERLVAFHLSH